MTQLHWNLTDFSDIPMEMKSTIPHDPSNCSRRFFLGQSRKILQESHNTIKAIRFEMDKL